MYFMLTTLRSHRRLVSPSLTRPNLIYTQRAYEMYLHFIIIHHLRAV